MRLKSLSLLVLASLVGSCASPPDAGLASARATIHMLGETIGVRPVGSDADRRARDVIVSALRGAGLTVRVQDVDAVRREAGVTARVSNIIATRDGPDRDAIALVSHYDSVPDGPGAQDDGLGVATCLTAVQELAAQPLRHSLMVIVTDGEEIGLMGARGVVTDPDVRNRVRAFLNFDGTGGTGPPVLFQAGPGWSDALTAWVRGARRPFGGSFAIEIYERLPNDTDFTVLSAHGITGLNFAPIGDSYVYHTDRDRPAGVADDTISREIANTVETVRQLDQTALRSVDDAPTYFDLGDRTAVVYGAAATRRLGAIALLVGFAGWVLVTREVVRPGFGSLARTALRAGVLSVVAFASMGTATGLLRTFRGELTPWYASPWWTFGGLMSIGCFAIWIGTRLWPAKAVDHLAPARALWVTLPVWIGLSAFLVTKAPGASYLTTLPLAAAGVGVLVSRRETWLRVGAAGLWALVLVLWAQNVVVLLGFMVPLFGWLPVATPAWLYAAVLTAAGVMMVPPVVAAGAGSAAIGRASPAMGVVSAFLALVFAVGACRADAYTQDRPARRFVRYVQDDQQHHAWWDIGGSDRGVAPRPAEPAGARWTPEKRPIAASVNVAPLPWSTVYRSTSSPLAIAPAEVQSTLVRGDGGRLALSVKLTPHALMSATLVLPRGVQPEAANLAGAMVHGQWSATYAVVRNKEVEFRVGLRSNQGLGGTVVLLTLAGVPTNGSISTQLPSWLPVGPSTWQARSLFILPVIPEG